MSCTGISVYILQYGYLDDNMLEKVETDRTDFVVGVLIKWERDTEAEQDKRRCSESMWEIQR